MPKPAAAAPAGGDGKKQAAPKAEKPAVVDDKKPKQQPKQEDKVPEKQPQGRGKGKQQEEEPAVVVESSAKGGPKQYEDDDVEKAIKLRIAKIDGEIEARKKEVEQIRTSIDSKKAAQTQLRQKQADDIKEYKDQKKEGDGDAKEAKPTKSLIQQKQEASDRLKHLYMLQKQNNAEQKSLRAQLGGAANTTDTKKFNDALELEIRGLQERQASGTITNLLEEKKIIAEIGKLNNSKKLFKQYNELRTSITGIEDEINKLKADKERIKEEQVKYQETRKEFDEKISKSRAEHESNSSEIEQAIKKRTELNNIINELREKVNACYDEIRAHKAAKREKVEQEKVEAANKKIQKRQQDEEEKGYYADELEACTQLLQYLEPFKYREPVATEEPPAEEGEKEKEKEGEKEGEEGEKEDAPAPSTPPPSKRGGKKKEKQIGETDKEKELKHGAQTFFQFETLSLLAPQKVGDVEGTITQINEKKAFLEKREEEKKASRKTNGKK